ncbi:MAG TPA: glycine--tRNA ligase, partial [Candidatus Borkfalkia avicola]|nr:glycine--tRNA ligase [Candidatus Borkfalkia avicola]
FRTIEFEQMEHQWFCKEGTDLEYYEEYKQKAKNFLLGLGFKEEHLRFKDHDKLAHYAKSACDIQYLFPMGWSELNGIHDRTDYDLSRHQEYSGKNLNYLDPATGEHYIPYVVEYSIGADRLMLAVLCEAYEEEELEGGDVRTVMHFHPALAAYKAAVLPLQKNLGEKAREVYKKLAKKFMVTYDEAGSIGKRYRRQDEIGTPYCITIDFDTLENNTVTVRDRDTMAQIRLDIDEVAAYIEKSLEH